MLAVHQLPRVLCVSDTALTRHFVCNSLMANGCNVVGDANGVAVEQLIDDYRPDLVVTGLDDVELGVLERLSALPTNPPMIILARADHSPESLRRAWRSGAVDVLVEPFDEDELGAAVAPHIDQFRHQRFGIGDLSINALTYSVERAGQHLQLTRTEFRLLVTMVRHTGVVLSKRQLLALVWDFEDYAENLVEVHISALRRKLEEYGPRMIHTVRGFGYLIQGSVWGRPSLIEEYSHAG
jgi:DNA-binding response OmpR family regulator